MANGGTPSTKSSSAVQCPRLANKIPNNRCRPNELQPHERRCRHRVAWTSATSKRFEKLGRTRILFGRNPVLAILERRLALLEERVHSLNAFRTGGDQAKSRLLERMDGARVGVLALQNHALRSRNRERPLAGNLLSGVQRGFQQRVGRKQSIDETDVKRGCRIDRLPPPTRVPSPRPNRRGARDAPYHPCPESGRA